VLLSFHPCEELIVTKASLPSASSFKRASLLILKNDKEEQRRILRNNNNGGNIIIVKNDGSGDRQTDRGEVESVFG
jgi:hypothetical protein